MKKIDILGYYFYKENLDCLNILDFFFSNHISLLTLSLAVVAPIIPTLYIHRTRNSKCNDKSFHNKIANTNRKFTLSFRVFLIYIVMLSTIFISFILFNVFSGLAEQHECFLENPPPKIQTCIVQDAQPPLKKYISCRGVGSDKSDKKSSIWVEIFSNSLSWPYAEHEYNLNNQEHKKFYNNLIDYLKADGTRARYQNGQGLIALGTASCEGKSKSQFELSDRRSEVLYQLLQMYLLPKQGQISDSNLARAPLGIYNPNTQSKKACNSNNSNGVGTDMQRRVILIKILHEDPKVNISEAIFSALKTLDFGEFDIKRYDAFRDDFSCLTIRYPTGGEHRSRTDCNGYSLWDNMYSPDKE